MKISNFKRLLANCAISNLVPQEYKYIRFEGKAFSNFLNYLFFFFVLKFLLAVNILKSHSYKKEKE